MHSVRGSAQPTGHAAPSEQSHSHSHSQGWAALFNRMLWSASAGLQGRTASLGRAWPETAPRFDPRQVQQGAFKCGPCAGTMTSCTSWRSTAASLRSCLRSSACSRRSTTQARTPKPSSTSGECRLCCCCCFSRALFLLAMCRVAVRALGLRTVVMCVVGTCSVQHGGVQPGSAPLLLHIEGVLLDDETSE